MPRSILRLREEKCWGVSIVTESLRITLERPKVKRYFINLRLSSKQTDLGLKLESIVFWRDWKHVLIQQSFYSLCSITSHVVLHFEWFHLLLFVGLKATRWKNIFCVLPLFLILIALGICIVQKIYVVMLYIANSDILSNGYWLHIEIWRVRYMTKLTSYLASAFEKKIAWSAWYILVHQCSKLVCGWLGIWLRG